MFSTVCAISPPSQDGSVLWRSLSSFRRKRDDSIGKWKILIFKSSLKCLCVGQMSGFSQFISNMSRYTDQLESIRSIILHPHRFSSINHIYIMSLELTAAYIEFLKPILASVEVMQVRDCRIEGAFYENFLKYCKNVRRLYVQNVDLEQFEFEIVESRHKTKQFSCHWLQKSYQFLEHFELTPQNSCKIAKLQVFFEQNPQIRSFSTNSCCLYDNWLQLIKTTANLEYLAIDFNCWPRIYLDSICDVLNFLHQRRFYHRLHLYLPNLYGTPNNYSITLNALEKLYIKHLDHKKTSIIFDNLKELGVFEVAEETNLIDFVENCSKLKRAYFKTASLDDILPIVRYSPKVREIKIQHLEPGTHLYGRILDMKSLNKERSTLKNSQKVRIYVQPKIFIMSKKATEKTKFSCVKLKRIDLGEIKKKFEFLKGHNEFVALDQFVFETWN